MAKVFGEIDGKLAEWIARQRMFFVATAPSGDGGHVNCSPKGGPGTFRVVDGRTVAYLDFVGSGIETIAHLRENGRILIMFCEFEGPPRIVRLHGRGAVTQVGDPEFEDLHARLGFPADPGARSIVAVAVERISDSCGYGVPLMRYEDERPQREAWLDSRLRKHGPHGVLDYVLEQNAESIDGLPGVDVARLP